MSTVPKLSWPAILARAKEIVAAHGGDRSMTLRQLYYRLVVDPGIKLENKLNNYNRLGRLTAEARRAGRFPRLIDNGREVNRPGYFTDPASAIDWLVNQYRLDRQRNQEYAVYLGLEKHTLEGLVESWFEDRGLPIVACGGMSGEELVGDVARELRREKRATVLLYVGDFDPSGIQIPENFQERLAAYGTGFDHYERVALNADAVGTLPTSIQPVKINDPNYSRFEALCDGWGVEPVQIEAEALDPADLRQLIEDALEPWWDDAAHDELLEQERDDVAILERFQEMAAEDDE